MILLYSRLKNAIKKFVNQKSSTKKKKLSEKSGLLNIHILSHAEFLVSCFGNDFLII